MISKLHLTLAILALATCASAQISAPDQQPSSHQPHGTILFQSHGDSPEPDADRTPLSTAPSTAPAPEIQDAVRATITFTSYDLEAHLRPADSSLAVHAVLTLRNDGPTPLTLLPLQLSSALTWETISAANQPVPFTQHPLETDLDHTGLANEAVLILAHPLAPGATLKLNVFYSGQIATSAARLTRIGASAAQVNAADWDTLSPTAVRIRGFGNVLWYPIASPASFLGDGDKFFLALGRNKLANELTTAHLRLSVDYTGEPPVAAWFAGRRQHFTALSDNSAAPLANFGGIATAEFPLAPIGFRIPSLFLITNCEQPTPPNPIDPNDATESSSVPETAPILAVSTADDHSLPRLLSLADEVSPLLTDWLGPQPLTALSILNNSGQPYEDGPLLVAPIDALASTDAAPAMAHSLTHAWISTGQPWIDEGLAQFMAIEWTERTLGREAAIAKLQELVSPLALGEPAYATAAALAQARAGNPLIATGNDIFYRRKAAAVFFMLREITGDAALKAALTVLRTQAPSTASAEEQATAFRKLLESISHKDLAAFFNDWVLHDNGLPDLTVVDVTPRALPAGKGHDSGWLTAITVRNGGAAVADIPVTVRAGTFSITRRMRIAAFSSVTDRVLTEGQPTDVAINDGTVPEARSSVHTRNLVVHDTK